MNPEPLRARFVSVFVTMLIVQAVGGVIASPGQVVAYPPPTARKALVIGNGEYRSRPLANAVRDANAVAAALGNLGFAVTPVPNATLKEMERAIQKYVSELKAGDLSIVYYAGHGTERNNINYLIPTDFEFDRRSELPFYTYRADQLTTKIESVRDVISIVVLDACRNYQVGDRQIEGGLAGMGQALGTLIVYSTASGATADDNPGRPNGVFAEHFVNVLQERGWTVKEMFNEVRLRVYRDSRGHQFPWMSDGLLNDVRLTASEPSSRPNQAVDALPAPMEGLRGCEPPTDQDRGVCQALREWRQAYETLDANRVKRVWPLIDANGLGRLFRRAEGLSVDMACGRVQLGADGETARVACNVNYRYAWKTPVPDPAPITTIFEFRSKNGVWIIERLR